MMYWNLIKQRFLLQIISNLNQNIWCIEIHLNYIVAFYFYLEPKHMMYWNKEWNKKTTFKICNLNQNIWCIEMFINVMILNISLLEPKHMMYWNFFKHRWSHWINCTLNQNIWCIEINPVSTQTQGSNSWTKTYDVLKSLTRLHKMN